MKPTITEKLLRKGFSDLQAEKDVAAQVLSNDPKEAVERLIQAGITADHFTCEGIRKVWSIVKTYIDEGQTHKLATLQDDLWSIREPDKVDDEATEAFQSLTMLQGFTLTPPSTLLDAIKTLRDCHARRMAYRQLEDIENKSSEDIERECQSVIDATSATTSSLPSVTSFNQLIVKHPDRPKDLIEGVAGVGDKVILSAPSKAGKTWLMLQLAYAAQNGRAWLGHPCKKMDVLYVNFELTPVWMAHRAKLVLSKIGESEHPCVLNLRGYETGWEALSSHIRKHIEQSPKKYGLIILDPIYKMLGDEDENSNGDIARLLNSLERMGHVTETAIAFSHHHSKGNKSGVDAIERMSGAGVWGRDPDAIIDLVEHEEDDCYVVEAIPRNYAKPPKMVVKCDFPIFVLMEDADPSDLKKPGGSKKKITEADVVVMCEMHPLGIPNARLLEKLSEAHNTSEETARKRVKDTLRNGKIIEDGKLIKPIASTVENELIQGHYPTLENNELGEAV